MNTDLYLFERHQIDDLLWNKTIDRFPYGYPYAYTWYLDSVCERWIALANDDFSLIFPIPIKQKLGIKYAFTPWWTQQLGLITSNPEYENILPTIIKALMKRVMHINLMIHYGTPIELIKSIDELKVFEHRTYQLNLIHEYSRIWDNYTDKRRNNIRRALMEGLITKQHIHFEDFMTFFHVRAYRNSEYLTSAQIQVLGRLLIEALERNHCELWGVYKGEALIATAAFIRSEHYWTYIASATSLTGRKTHAMSLLLDRFFYEHAQENMIFDFEGSDIPSIAQFFKGFGAYPVTYYRLWYWNLPKWVLKFKELLQRVL